MLFTNLFAALNFVCIVWFSIINDHTFIASDKWTQKYVHCIVMCSLSLKDGLENKAGNTPVLNLIDIRTRIHTCKTLDIMA